MANQFGHEQVRDNNQMQASNCNRQLSKLSSSSSSLSVLVQQAASSSARDREHKNRTSQNYRTSRRNRFLANTIKPNVFNATPNIRHNNELGADQFDGLKWSMSQLSERAIEQLNNLKLVDEQCQQQAAQQLSEPNRSSSKVESARSNNTITTRTSRKMLVAPNSAQQTTSGEQSGLHQSEQFPAYHHFPADHHDQRTSNTQQTPSNVYHASNHHYPQHPNEALSHQSAAHYSTPPPTLVSNLHSETNLLQSQQFWNLNNQTQINSDFNDQYANALFAHDQHPFESHPSLNYVDLDEVELKSHHRQQQHQQQQQQQQRHLPESVVQSNKELNNQHQAAGFDDHERRFSNYLPPCSESTDNEPNETITRQDYYTQLNLNSNSQSIELQNRHSSPLLVQSNLINSNAGRDFQEAENELSRSQLDEAANYTQHQFANSSICSNSSINSHTFDLTSHHNRLTGTIDDSSVQTSHQNHQLLSSSMSATGSRQAPTRYIDTSRDHRLSSSLISGREERHQSMQYHQQHQHQQQELYELQDLHQLDNQTIDSHNIEVQDQLDTVGERFKVCEWLDCGNTFLDMEEFVRHLEERHVNQEPAEKNRYFCCWANCKRNNQEFNARYKLLIHMRVHSGEKPYACKSDNCRKSFSRLENLKIHVRSHTGEKPYKCNYDNCSKSFTNSSDRIKHHKTHKDPKPYNCTHDGCTKRYTDPSSLRKHLRAHKRHHHAYNEETPSNGNAAPVFDHSNDLQLEQQQQPQHPTCQGANLSSSQSQNEFVEFHPADDEMRHQTNDAQFCRLDQQRQQHHQLSADYDPTEEFESAYFGADSHHSDSPVHVSNPFAQIDPIEPPDGAQSLMSAQIGSEQLGNLLDLDQQQEVEQRRFWTSNEPTRGFVLDVSASKIVSASAVSRISQQHQLLSRSWCAGVGYSNIRNTGQLQTSASTIRSQQQNYHLDQIGHKQECWLQKNERTSEPQQQTSVTSWPTTTRNSLENQTQIVRQHRQLMRSMPNCGPNIGGQFALDPSWRSNASQQDQSAYQLRPR